MRDVTFSETVEQFNDRLSCSGKQENSTERLMARNAIKVKALINSVH